MCVTSYITGEDTEHGKTKKSLFSEVLVLKENGIHHHNIKGITQKINDLQASYNEACNWKQNTVSGILESDLVNGVKTIEGMYPLACVIRFDQSAATGIPLIPL
ncbi:hypothetical protein VP01_1038g1 [Puccinia sorghi]|uniref:Recombinase domain-containing protein n=1 Tax=Puccinia sorghi TaxID=27349 RepID=A0A0L6VUS7_9BASI|nr:hypothetical protein VP01_1038g1 [Puccinia sorghi]